MFGLGSSQREAHGNNEMLLTTPHIARSKSKYPVGGGGGKRERRERKGKNRLSHIMGDIPIYQL